MKLKVINETGDIETLTLRDVELTCIKGKFIDRLRSDGVEHFFTKDGFYDGWGGAVNATLAEADDAIAAMDEEREIVSPD